MTLSLKAAQAIAADLAKRVAHLNEGLQIATSAGMIVEVRIDHGREVATIGGPPRRIAPDIDVEVLIAPDNLSNTEGE